MLHPIQTTGVRGLICRLNGTSYSYIYYRCGGVIVVAEVVFVVIVAFTDVSERKLYEVCRLTPVQTRILIRRAECIAQRAKSDSLVQKRQEKTVLEAVGKTHAQIRPSHHRRPDLG